MRNSVSYIKKRSTSSEAGRCSAEILHPEISRVTASSRKRSRPRRRGPQPEIVSKRSGKKPKETYSATRIRRAGGGVELAILVLASSAEVVTLDLDVEVELVVGGRSVLEDRQPFAVVLANTKVERSPVADGTVTVAPLAGHLGGNALGVDVVLGGSRLALPVVVLFAVGAGQGVLGASVSLQRDGLGLGTCIIRIE